MESFYDTFDQWKQFQSDHEGPKFCQRCNKTFPQNEFRIVDQFLTTLSNDLLYWYNTNVNEINNHDVYECYHLLWNGKFFADQLNFCTDCLFLKLRDERDFYLSEDLFNEKILHISFKETIKKVYWGDTHAQELFQLYKLFLMKNFPILFFEILDRHQNDPPAYKPKI